MRVTVSWRNVLVVVGVASGGFFSPHDPSVSAWRDLAGTPTIPASPARRSPTSESSASLRQHIAAGYAAPLSFEPNRGQTDPQVKFLSRGKGYTLFLTSTEAIVSLRRTDAKMGTGDSGTQARTSPLSVDGRKPARRDLRPLMLRMRPVGGNPTPRVVGQSRLPGAVNYVRGRDRKASVTGIPTYGRVRYEDVYPGVDLAYYGNGHELEYDFIVAAGADPDRIRFTFTGVEKLTLNDAGALVLHTPAGELQQPAPVIYQEVDGIRRAIAGGYILTGAHEIGFRVGAYDHTRPLVIDPVLDYSTYFGGASDEIGWDIAVDGAGNAYITGARPSVRFQDSYDYDAYVAKFSASGALLWRTDLGDTCDDDGRSIAVDSTGHTFITGQLGYCYPYPELQAGAFAAKLSPTGAAHYVFPFSGDWTADVGQAIAVDASGNAYVGGVTSSTYFPVTPGAFQQQHGGGIGDGFIVKINAAGTALLYATYLGGDNHESLNDIAIDGSGRAYVTGSTSSWDFPTRNAYQPQHPGWGPVDLSAFVSKLSADGSSLVYSTYLGGGPNDMGQGIAVDSSGNAYVTGVTESEEFPTTPGAVQPQPGDNRLCFYRLCTDAFVTKLNASGTALLYSTYLGGNIFDEGSGIAIDAAGNAYVTGNTRSSTFPVVNAFQPNPAGEVDAFVVKLNPAGSAFVYSSYLGGSRTSDSFFDGDDGGIRIAVDRNAGTAYVVGLTYSAGFPVMNAHQPIFGGGLCGWSAVCSDAFVTKIRP